jgi:hypothetical protein
MLIVSCLWAAESCGKGGGQCGQCFDLRPFDEGVFGLVGTAVLNLVADDGADNLIADDATDDDGDLVRVRA